MSRVEKIQNVLRSAFQPTLLEVTDESHLHVGHVGAATGRGHFKVIIASPSLNAVSRVTAHQMIYQALGPLIQTDIHAISIDIKQLSVHFHLTQERRCDHTGAGYCAKHD